MKSGICLVTGGTGFIGSALVKALVKKGRRVRTYDNDWRGSPEKLGDTAKHVEIMVGDIRDAEAVRRAVRGVGSVYHLAAINGTRYFYSQPELVLEVAIKGMTNVMDACIKEDVHDLALASSSEVYQTPAVVPTPETVPMVIPDPLNPRYSYGGGKIISELMALHYGGSHFKRVVIWRPHNVYGPDMGEEHVIPQIIRRLQDLSRANKPPFLLPIQGTGQESRAFVYIDDLMDGLMCILEKGDHRGIYNIGTQDEVTIEHVAREIANCFKMSVTLVPGTSPQGGTPRRCPDLSKVRALGYEPRVSLPEGLAKTVKWYRENSK